MQTSFNMCADICVFAKIPFSQRATVRNVKIHAKTCEWAQNLSDGNLISKTGKERHAFIKKEKKIPLQSFIFTETPILKHE